MHIFSVTVFLVVWGCSLARYDDGLQKQTNGFADRPVG